MDGGVGDHRAEALVGDADDLAYSGARLAVIGSLGVVVGKVRASQERSAGQQALACRSEKAPTNSSWVHGVDVVEADGAPCETSQTAVGAIGSQGVTLSTSKHSHESPRFPTPTEPPAAGYLVRGGTRLVPPQLHFFVRNFRLSVGPEAFLGSQPNT